MELNSIDWDTESEAIHLDSEITVVSSTIIETLKERAKSSPRNRFRLCLHKNNEDLVQDMIIAFCKNSEIPIHRHSEGKSETFNVIEGKLTVLIFDDFGNLIDKIKLGDKLTKLPSVYRISAPFWHTIIIDSEVVVLHEITTGPFDPNKEKEIPKWTIGKKIKQK